MSLWLPCGFLGLAELIPVTVTVARAVLLVLRYSSAVPAHGMRSMSIHIHSLVFFYSASHPDCPTYLFACQQLGRYAVDLHGYTARAPTTLYCCCCPVCTAAATLSCLCCCCPVLFMPLTGLLVQPALISQCALLTCRLHWRLATLRRRAW
jgi:hypothetical protein